MTKELRAPILYGREGKWRALRTLLWAAVGTARRRAQDERCPSGTKPHYTFTIKPEAIEQAE